MKTVDILDMAVVFLASPQYLSVALVALRGRKLYRCTLAERGDLYRVVQVGDV